MGQDYEQGCESTPLPIGVMIVTDYEIARNIIDSRIAYHNKNNPKDELKFISKMINEEDFKMLIDSAEGNIRYLLCAMKEFYLSNFLRY